MLSIFLSHNHSDKPFTRRLAERLQAHGMRVWLDEAEMNVGDSLFSKIESAIRECTYLAVILSPQSVSSPWVQREVNQALTQEIHGQRVKVLPLLKEKCEIPGFLLEKLYADFTEDFESGLSVLLNRLDSDLHGERHRQKRAYEILQSGYQDWIAFSRQDSHLLDRPTVSLVLEYVREPSLSVDLLEFLFASIAFVQAGDAHFPKVARLNDWAGGQSSLLLDRLLAHTNSRIRIRSLELFRVLGNRSVADRILKAIREEKDRNVRRAALHAASHLEIPLPAALSSELLDSDPDWVVQSYALRAHDDKIGCLVVSDGTDFAAELGAMAADAGFHVVTWMPPFDLSTLHEDLLGSYRFVAVVRGEHFTQYGNDSFYTQLRQFVSKGGILFATSWVSWETNYHREFAEILPFSHIRNTYNEGIYVTCRPTNENFAQQLLAKPTSYCTSFELLKRREGATVLLETEDEVPLLGFRSFGSGICYYFNTCQHHCLGQMESPLTANSSIRCAIRGLLKRIHSEAMSRRRGS